MNSLMINSETYDTITSDRERADQLADLFDMDLAFIHNIYIEESLVRFEMTQDGVTFVAPGSHVAAAHLFAVIK